MKLSGNRFRYYIHDSSSAFRFQLGGRLEGHDVTELEQCWRTARSAIGERNFMVDVSELTAADEAGRELLGRWRGLGAQFVDNSAPAPPARLRLGLAALPALILLVLLLPLTVWAGSESAAALPGAAAALARYTAGIEQNQNHSQRGADVIDIDAALPKLAKKGRLEAIRRFAPFGRPQYEVLQFEGDRTVRQQVIARYLSADAQAQTLPASSLAISPANYKFRFVGSIGAAPSLTYVFRITPKKKRVGLIQGELWIDAATGLAVHQAGHVVKRPSVFLRRIEVTQDTDIREGRPYLRITRLEIETRLVGRAELTIKEHPGAADQSCDD